jgi:hypothetical protein
MIVDSKEHKKYLGFCSQECFEKSQKDLLIKDVDWDSLKMENKTHITYKELRSLVKNEKMSFSEACNLVTRHFQKILGKTLFPHQESQKESIIVMD